MMPITPFTSSCSKNVHLHRTQNWPNFVSLHPHTVCVEKYLRKTVQRKGGKQFSTGKHTHTSPKQDKTRRHNVTRQGMQPWRSTTLNVMRVRTFPTCLTQTNRQKKERKNLQTFTFRFPLTLKHPEPLSHLEQTNFLSHLVTKYCRAKKNTMSCDKLELT